MKIRNGFVSNSSSSSFIVIDGSKGYTKLTINGNFIGGDNGIIQFGWDNIKYTSIFDKINFTYLQTNYGKDHNRLQMLEEVLKENIPGITDICWNITDKWDDEKPVGYIDHQSSSVEGKNLEMFNNKNTLKDFIFGVGSYIQGGNDNM